MISRERLVSSVVHFCLLLGCECYQFVFNLPLLLQTIVCRRSFSPLSVPAPHQLVQSGLGKTLMILDLVTLHLVNLVEYHVILYPALVLFTVLGHQERLEAVRARMEQFHSEGEIEDVVSLLMEELVERIVETDGVAIKEDRDDQNDKSLQASLCHESGYLSVEE